MPHRVLVENTQVNGETTRHARSSTSRSPRPSPRSPRSSDRAARSLGCVPPRVARVSFCWSTSRRRSRSTRSPSTRAPTSFTGVAGSRASLGAPAVRVPHAGSHRTRVDHAAQGSGRVGRRLARRLLRSEPDAPPLRAAVGVQHAPRGCRPCSERMSNMVRVGVEHSEARCQTHERRMSDTRNESVRHSR